MDGEKIARCNFAIRSFIELVVCFFLLQAAQSNEDGIGTTVIEGQHFFGCNDQDMIRLNSAGF